MTRQTVSAAPPVTLVVFGATGDLTKRLLVPALINMTRFGLVDDTFDFLGVGIEDETDESLRAAFDDFDQGTDGEGAVEKGDAWEALKKRISYLQGDFTKDQIYRDIADYVSRSGRDNVAFYLAVHPRFFGDIVEKLAGHGLLDQTEAGFRRVAIEKPFGSDLESAKALNARVLSHAAESQIYRVDHFLGKETVQNILTARFANTMIERLWNADAIDSVQITAAETVDVGMRAKFYDSIGALRDMVPNHLFTLLAMVTMEPPNGTDPEAIRDEKTKLLKAIRIYSPEEAKENGVRGVYEGGSCAGRKVTAYTDLDEVKKDSNTETYVALKLAIDTWRWSGVPFYLRTGKVMSVRDTEVVVQFKPVPKSQFGDAETADMPANRLVLQIQPDEGIRMDILIKKPGLEMTSVPVSLDFTYAKRFDVAHLVGYETLLYDLFIGDQTLFQRADAIEAAWAAVQPFLDLWKSGKPDAYEPGSLGPDAADSLIERDGRSWHALSEERDDGDAA